MAMPVFGVGDDPGTDFPRLLARIGAVPGPLPAGPIQGVPHATTCVALRYSDGVVMAGDRRATSGHLISHRSMEKVVQADRFSGVAIAGAAGPAVEMIRLFQVQLEYYEKVQGTALSLEGKANQLSAMVRANLPAAMQGLGVVPIVAGFDIRRGVGRLWDYDMLGGRDAAREVVARVGLEKRIGSKVRTYSHGMRQRLALAQALLPEPELLLLDEPTDGLDPEGIKWFRDFILSLRKERGMTVLFNSHLLAEVELMCDRVAILREGKRVFEGSVKSFREEIPIYHVELEPSGHELPVIEALGGAFLDGGRITLPADVDPAAAVENLVKAGVRVRAFARIRRSLEDVYMEILNGKGSPN